MQRSRIPALLVLTTLVLLVALCPGQTRNVIPLPAGMPDLDGPIFANENAVAALGGGMVHVVTGLQDTSTATTFTVAPP